MCLFKICVDVFEGHGRDTMKDDMKEEEKDITAKEALQGQIR